MWDCAYSLAIGVDAAVRRSNEEQYVHEYLRLLANASGGSFVVPSFDDAMVLLRRMYLMISYFGWLLERIGGVGQTQGNTENDLRVWRARVLDVVEVALATPSTTLPNTPLAIVSEYLEEIRKVLRE